MARLDAVPRTGRCSGPRFFLWAIRSAAYAAALYLSLVESSHKTWVPRNVTYVITQIRTLPNAQSSLAFPSFSLSPTSLRRPSPLRASLFRRHLCEATGTKGTEPLASGKLPEDAADLSLCEYTLAAWTDYRCFGSFNLFGFTGVDHTGRLPAAQRGCGHRRLYLISGPNVARSQKAV